MRNKIRHEKAILCRSLLKAFSKGTTNEIRKIPVSILKTNLKRIAHTNKRKKLTY